MFYYRMRSKRGQATLFIIIAVVIVAVIVLIIVIRQTMVKEKPTKPEEPISYIEDCVKIALEEIADDIRYDLCGEPPYHSLCYCCYNGNYVPILCLSEEPNKGCEKRPLPTLLSDENKTFLNESIISCIKDAKDWFIQKGYDVRVCNVPKWELKMAGQLVLNIECPMTFSKVETYSFDSFTIFYQFDFNALWGGWASYVDAINDTLNLEHNIDIGSQEDLGDLGVDFLGRIVFTDDRTGISYWIALFQPSPNLIFAAKERI